MKCSTEISLPEKYAFLSYSIKFPSKDIMNPDYISFLKELLHGCGQSACQKELAEKIELSENFLEDIQIEYTALFINNFPQLPAPPYESFYLSPNRLLNDKITDDVLSFYNRCGFSFEDIEELPDHISVELEFLGLLAEDRLTEEYNEFLNSHFIKWFPEFKERVLENSTHPFYKAIVELITEAVETNPCVCLKDKGIMADI